MQLRNHLPLPGPLPAERWMEPEEVQVPAATSWLLWLEGASWWSSEGAWCWWSSVETSW